MTFLPMPLYGILTLVAAATLFLVISPPLQYFWHYITERLGDIGSGYSGYWFWRSYQRTGQRHSRHARKAFDRWFAARFSGTSEDGVVNDDDLVLAQELTPILRQLLEEELPTNVRRCNEVHRRMAALVRAVHMREIAAEPECMSLRHWTVLLLDRAAELLAQYPLALRLDAVELLDATVVVRKGLLPTCTHCPYIRKPVSEAGQFCPASQLIGLDGKAC